MTFNWETCFVLVQLWADRWPLFLELLRNSALTVSQHFTVPSAVNVNRIGLNASEPPALDIPSIPKFWGKKRWFAPHVRPKFSRQQNCIRALTLVFTYVLIHYPSQVRKASTESGFFFNLSKRRGEFGKFSTLASKRDIRWKSNPAGRWGCRCRSLWWVPTLELLRIGNTWASGWSFWRA